MFVSLSIGIGSSFLALKILILYLPYEISRNKALLEILVHNSTNLYALEASNLPVTQDLRRRVVDSGPGTIHVTVELLKKWLAL